MVDIYWARQLINQRLQEAKSALPDSIDPQMSPLRLDSVRFINGGKSRAKC